MTDAKMRLELKENRVEDNPFDVMLYHSLELTRELLFACHRLRNPEVSEELCINKNKINSYMDNIKEEFSKLQNMSDETVSMCRESAHYYPNDIFEKMNTILLGFENDMETLFSRCNPVRNDRFEKIRLGVESDEYQRLLELRDIITNSKEISSVSDDYLYALCDVIKFSDEYITLSMSPEDLKDMKKIINKYSLTEDEIEYMISYRNRKK